MIGELRVCHLLDRPGHHRLSTSTDYARPELEFATLYWDGDGGEYGYVLRFDAEDDVTLPDTADEFRRTIEAHGYEVAAADQDLVERMFS